MQEALAALPGVAKCEVDFATKTATCQVEDPQKFDPKTAVDALAAAGFADSSPKN